MSAATTPNPEQVILKNGENIVDYAGETIAEHEIEQRYGDGTDLSLLYWGEDSDSDDGFGNGTGLYCIGGEESDSDDGFDTPLVDCAYS